MLGSNGAGKTTLFNCITGDFPPTAGRDPLLRRGRDGVSRPRAHPPRVCAAPIRSAAVPGPDGHRQRLSSPAAASRAAAFRSCGRARRDAHDGAGAMRSRSRVHLDDVLETPVVELSHGQQRQLEIALALAGAPRFILFDEPAAGLSPTERRDLVAILTALPRAYRLHHHRARHGRRAARRRDVTMMHNGRIFKEGTPQRDRDRPGGAGDLSRRRAWLSRSTPPTPKPILQVQDLNVYYGESHALQGVVLTLEHGVLSVVGRNGMGKTTLCKTIIGLDAAFARLDPLRRAGLVGRRAAEIARARRRLSCPQGRRLWRSLTVDEHSAHDARAAARRAGRSSASTRPSRGWPSGATTAAASSPAASSRCWRSLARSAEQSRACSSWTSRPRGSRR